MSISECTEYRLHNTKILPEQCTVDINGTNVL